ncbi:unnamed protein product, partial [Sphagnum balticum]
LRGGSIFSKSSRHRYRGDCGTNSTRVVQEQESNIKVQIQSQSGTLVQNLLKDMVLLQLDTMQGIINKVNIASLSVMLQDKTINQPIVLPEDIKQVKPIKTLVPLPEDINQVNIVKVNQALPWVIKRGKQDKVQMGSALGRWRGHTIKHQILLLLA